MNDLALHIPPEKLIPPLLALLEPALQGNDPLYKRAAYLSMAVIAEGCSEAICAKYLPILLGCVKTGISDPNPIVSTQTTCVIADIGNKLNIFPIFFLE